VKWCCGRFSVFTATFSSTSTFSSLVKKELMLNPDVDGRFDKGFEVFTMTFSSCTETTASVFVSFIS